MLIVAIFNNASKLFIWAFDVDVRTAQEHVLDEVGLVGSSSSSVRTKAVSMRSMPKALSGARLAGRAQAVAHRGRFGSLLQVIRFVSVLLLLQLLLRRRPMFALTFSPITSINHSRSQ
jgi:hypothetical protein